MKSAGRLRGRGERAPRGTGDGRGEVGAPPQPREFFLSWRNEKSSEEKKQKRQRKIKTLPLCRHDLATTPPPSIAF